jgi:hypothetical protein
VSDFGADVAFAKVMDKMVEHYGILLSETTIRRVTQGHARVIFDAQPTAPQPWPSHAGAPVVIAEMDGGMVPIVESDPNQADQRKGKRLQWKEAKICLAHAQGSATIHYGGSLRGDVTSVGQQWFGCAVAVGFGVKSEVHAIGDGAEWIAKQSELQFGANGEYLLDFYHVCEYLSAAAEAMHSTSTAASAWLSEQKMILKTRGAMEVLATLATRLEAQTVADDAAPVRRCVRYLSQRRRQLNYPKAIQAGRPIGSGRIESAHRYVVQERLKRAGAWWRADHADHMLAMRICRGNHGWHCYWQKLTQTCAA